MEAFEQPDIKALNLKNWERERITTKVRKEARAQCAVEFEAYIACMNNNVVSGAWRCKKTMYVLNDCLDQYTTAEDFQKATGEYVEKERQQLYDAAKERMEKKMSAAAAKQ
eukprot:comp9423_c0_seq1/m.4478 comp9423_c0_seq1/g.4478  ORF comp9423_c0_seq1/g.4478 comp9423_c0_seq1/m.4478 type:complete len:111 (-) comp9423_c0_seq1:494-826(-)